MATPVAHTQSGNQIVQAIEGNIKHSGTITYNIVELANAAEINAWNGYVANFNPPDPPMTMDLGAVWVQELAQAAAMFMEYANFNIVFNNDINADYLVGQDTSGNLGYANYPQAPQALMAF